MYKKRGRRYNVSPPNLLQGQGAYLLIMVCREKAPRRCPLPQDRIKRELFKEKECVRLIEIKQ
jgi:hypothetical protein